MMTDGSTQLDAQQMLWVFRRDQCPSVGIAGVACNERVAARLRDDIQAARQRWGQPVEIVIDPRLRCHQNEVYYSPTAWQERRGGGEVSGPRSA